MNNSELCFSDMKELMGSVKMLTTGEIAEDITIEFDAASKKKIEKILNAGGVITRDVQDLYITEISFPKTADKLLTKGQSPWVKTDKGYAVTSQPISVPHFCAKLQTLVPSVNDRQTYSAVEITIGNFSFDFSKARKDESDDDVYYKNVGLIVYPGNNTVKVLEED